MMVTGNREVIDAYVALEGAPLKALLSEKDRTGIGARRLLHEAHDLPDGLNASKINSWFNGGAKSARADHYDYVLGLWRACAPLSKITPELRAQLCAERDRTGVGVIALLRPRRDIPEGLNASRLSQWLNGRARNALASEIEYVLALWKALPDDEWVELTPDLVARIQEARRSSGVSPAVLARQSRLQLIDITVLDITRALSGGARTVRRRHLELMLNRVDIL
jgi:hypothetical protein